ncbi:MAG TPA: AmmeMemoRadiSam system radical SAM enzyme [Candidatus Brocadiia bacterium]|nr:AmmeMemoRadiSam system radical SAM enzyme [Candidatus Brocadiia bacterium]
MKATRREILKTFLAGAGGAVCRFAAPVNGGDNPVSDHEAMAYRKLDEKRIECLLCPRNCRVADMERGYCGVRENQGGTYKTLVYARPCSIHTDPVEKKPLFHFKPGSIAFSLATAGCNVECKFCQNWEISQFRPEDVANVYLPPDQVAEAARRAKEASGKPCCIAYTYSEPVVFFEYMFDCARAGNHMGVDSVMISNGYITETPMKELVRHLKAVKIDLKGFSEKFYKEMVNAELKPVLDTLLLLRKENVYFEIVTLLIPTLNDSDEELKSLCKWIHDNLGEDVPVHFTRFNPCYKVKNLPPTPVGTLQRAWRIGQAEGLHYVYVGNVAGHPGEHTSCPKCGKKLIERYSFTIIANRIKDGKCCDCGNPIPGVW